MKIHLKYPVFHNLEETKKPNLLKPNYSVKRGTITQFLTKIRIKNQGWSKVKIIHLVYAYFFNSSVNVILIAIREVAINTGNYNRQNQCAFDFFSSA